MLRLLTLCRLMTFLMCFTLIARAQESGSSEPIVREIGSRRELFVDRFLIDRLENATLKLHEPRLAPEMTEPADNMEYGTVIKDGDLFRLYTRDARGSKFDGDTTEVTRYCESRDGIHWTKPRLGLIEIDGSKDNNVILHEAPYCHNFSPFLDQRPGVPAEERFKALAGTVKTGLAAFISADGKREQVSGWGDIDRAVAYCLAAVRETCERFGGAPNAIIYTGFSRGGYAANFLALRTPEIASLWRAILSSRNPGLPWDADDVDWNDVKIGWDDRAERMKAEWFYARPNLGAEVHADVYFLQDSPSTIATREWLARLLSKSSNP